MYDYIIVGTGLSGAIFGYEAQKIGKKVLFIEKRSHVGGNIYTENINGITVHKYGPHIFHCNNFKIWKYINKFSKFNNYIHRQKANYKNQIYSLPVNLLTICQIYNVSTPEEAKAIIEEKRIKIKNPKNAEEWCLSTIGPEIYNLLYKGYTEKQWNQNPKNLPTSIVKRLPIRFSFDDNYHNSLYQGIPIGGYTEIINKMIGTAEVKLNTDFNEINWKNYAKNLVYSGSLDDYYNYCFGELQYRTLRWENEQHEVSDYQGCSVMSFPDINVPHTRIIEHKHFEFGKQNYTIITKEYPETYKKGKERLYPIENENNIKIYKKYKEKAQLDNIIVIGRLGNYKYMDMDACIGSTLKTFRATNQKNTN